MSGYILCQGKRARFPYYIENISTNIYTLEELCYYLNHNIYLLDETILNEGLCRWILEELGLRKLYDKLYRMLDEKVPAGTFILPIFKEIHYLTMEEFRELNVRVQKLEQEPPLLRQKIKGDYLMENGKYVNAWPVSIRKRWQSWKTERWVPSLQGRSGIIWAAPTAGFFRWMRPSPVLKKL